MMNRDEMEKCKFCGGKGCAVNLVMPGPKGILNCPECNGSGKRPVEDCYEDAWDELQRLREGLERLRENCRDGGYDSVVAEIHALLDGTP
jgi:hypothetical protein